ncbi:drebrin isoform X39 [Lates calcarifer]|uniref:Drebrin n=1 Tax=Lates calcarifer TaxID=8187 RepID=A0AAJ8BLV8_LATCA|nr:drebrin isoform X21 [Lates calcarifer]XP_050934623.1 drebrin isoform X22 [Lates calcarifer]XP_050934624.1 drebrin isoform X23 [Lates calcarifer]XP_050934625.1 drebrin isoform X24 [Lates calcarifer]XP_050934626.1 drebrin isoform X25 [Lates calcarifer]XP_050934627.1 drebrin isoform X26 [Lates calcarifer]XP_050934641.1 drebrin isoform X39 [Lates calcarifer]
MAVNLGKNRLALLTAYQDVIDETSDTDWALYTYEDDTNDLTLAASGGGGLAEITLTFDSGRVMYGFCSLKEPTAALPRYILINWVGEDVPDARKCACASHVATIADFFQGVEVIVNASSLDDIDPSAIGQRLTNGTAAVASPVLSRLRTRDEEHGDVGTVYQKTNAEVEMKKINREEFWEQAKREEEMRKEEEKKKAAEERQRFEEERMELERKEQENREKRYRERERQIEEHRKKMQEEEEARERLRNQTTIAAELSIEDLNLDKKESEVEEAKAIIAQRSGNPREFFKQKERAMTISVDTSPVSIHRTGRLDSPFLRQQHSPSSPSPTPPPRGASPLRTPPPHARTQPAAAAASTERSMAAVSPIPKIVTTPIKEDFSRVEEDSRDEWDSVPEQKPPVQESASTKPVQSVAPQARDSSGFSVWGSGTDSLVNLWDSSSAPPADPSQTSQSSNLVDLMGDADDSLPSATAATASGRPQPLLSFDEMMDGTFCSSTGAEDDPSSLVDVTGSDQMTLSYQHALQHASSDGQELDDGQLLMTNGETLLKEGTQVRQASEGYFSQSQEEEFGQSEESSAKPAPVFYNKPPEIDITCWDTDPVVDDDDD